MNIAEEAVSVVLRDVESSSPIQLRIDPSPMTLADGDQGVTLTVDGRSSVGVVVNAGQSAEERLVIAADLIQDWLVESLADAGLSAVWPPCPEHPDSHPLTAAVDERGGVWKCPGSGTVVADIGSFARPA